VQGIIPSSCGCGQNSVLCGLLDEGLNSLPCGSPCKAACSPKPAGELSQFVRKVEVTVLHNYKSDIPSPLPGPTRRVTGSTFTQEEGFTQRHR
jgi:hypothetical protein